MSNRNQQVTEIRDRLFLLRVSLGIDNEDEWNRGMMKAHEELSHYPDITWDVIVKIVVPIFADRER